MDFSCSNAVVAAVSFLLKNKFRFDLPLLEGVAYLSRQEEGQIRASWTVRDAEKAGLEDMVLKADDKPLVDHIHLSVRKWMSQSLVEREDYLNIPHTSQGSPRIKHIPAALNRYQIRLTHQTIRKDYPGLKTVGKDGFVQITVRNEKEDLEQKLRQERYREQDVAHAIEFRWLVEALCGGDISNIPGRYFRMTPPGEEKPGSADTKPDDGGKPDDDESHIRQFAEDLQQKLSTRRRVLFGHNCFTDLIYLYACFIGDPPEKVEDFQELIHGLFPAVGDTKYLASLVNRLKFHSNLEALEKEMRTELLPAIEIPAAFDRYVWEEHFHEAGYDSFMTAKIAIKLSAKLEKERRLGEGRKPVKIIKSGQTILTDAITDREDEEQSEEYVTASETAETESIVSALVAKLSGVFLAPTDAAKSRSQSPTIRQPSAQLRLPEEVFHLEDQDAKSTKPNPQPVDARLFSDTDPKSKPELRSQDQDLKVEGQIQPSADPGPAPQTEENLRCVPEDAASIIPTSGTAIVAVKEMKVEWRSSAEVKRVKSKLSQNNLFDILDTPVRPKTNLTPTTEYETVYERITNENEETKHSETDLLIWSDREGGEEEDQDDDESEEVEGGTARATDQDIIREVDLPAAPMTAAELEEKMNEMAAKGEMMPRWESDSGIWNVIGNRLVVNASEVGVCIL